MKPSEMWSGGFGDDYHKRNRVDWRKRMQFWKTIMDITGARSVYEVGCGPGWNLSAIKACSGARVRGEDINNDALLQAEDAGLEVWNPEETLSLYQYGELVLTSGVLIHIPSDELKDFMQRVIDLSYYYVLCVEYEAEKEEEVLYRGNTGMLWRRPYGKMYEEMGLTKVASGFLGPDEGFDNCTYTLLRKP